MPSSARSIAIAAAVLLLAAGSGCRQTPEATPVAEEPGHAVIYPDGAQAEADITAALAKATREKKRVLLDFGGNWCGDCQVLEIYFHDPANRNLLESNYVLVPVNIGRYDENLAIAARYGVPVSKGVPALAVLDPSGQVVLQPTERRVRVHGQNGSAVGDRLPAAVEGLEHFHRPSWPRAGVHVPSMAWVVGLKNSASPC